MSDAVEVAGAPDPLEQPRAVIVWEYGGIVYAARGPALELKVDRPVREVPWTASDPFPRWEYLPGGETVSVEIRVLDSVTFTGTLDEWWGAQQSEPTDVRPPAALGEGTS